jgi:hypothetical protein
LDEGEKVRHHSGKLAQVVLLCASAEDNKEAVNKKDAGEKFGQAFTSA